MATTQLKPYTTKGALRIDGSDDVVVIDNVTTMPEEEVYIDKHRLILVCTAGTAEFDYDGMRIHLKKNDVFLFVLRNSVSNNFRASDDFSCRQIWITATETFGVDAYGSTSLLDFIYLRQHPKVFFTNNDIVIFNKYFDLLKSRMQDNSPLMYQNIVGSIISAMIYEMLSVIRRNRSDMEVEYGFEMSSRNMHAITLTDHFIQMLEHCDGRIRKVEDFSNQLNVTPKYLSNTLKITIDRRPSELIQFYTIKAIERRLRYTDMTMNEIAEDLNFPNASFFGKYFKEHTGMTPLEFHKKNHGGHLFKSSRKR
ncbi:MAG: helix-turn-helix domain-containing protein [Bacteroidaceae bacterium]|nr:helix-turn-helix domain-containing protein [Bacteroidaceae bacterium]